MIRTISVFLLIILMLWSGEAEATTAIAIRTENIIVVGADGKVNWGDYSGSQAGCKIGIANNILWAKSGILGLPAARFDIDLIARSAISSATSILAGVKVFEENIIPRFVEILAGLRRGNPDNFRSKWDGKPVLKIVFIGFENGIAHLHSRELSAYLEDGDVVVRRNDAFDCPSAECENGYVILGSHEAADAILATNSDIWTRFHADQVIARLIEAEIAANPRDVGEPIAIAAIDRNGVQWLRAGACAPKQGQDGQGGQ